jgi:hypothetical protein
MWDLVTSEVRRVTSRRLTRVLCVLGLLGAVTVGSVLFLQTSSADADAIAARRAVARQEERQAESAFLDCLYAEQHAGPQAPRARCSEPNGAKVDDPRLSGTKARGYLRGTAGVAALLAWVLGASVIGAEHQSRGLTTTLTFEARRGRVFAAKAVSAVGVAVAWAAGVAAAMLAALLPALLLHGAMGAGQPGYGDLVVQGARGVALAGFAAGLGFALASLGRNTAVALGGGVAYLMVFENILGGALEGWRSWLLTGNIVVWLTGEAQSDIPGRSVVGAAVVLTAIAGGLLAAGAGAFRARDVA